MDKKHGMPEWWGYIIILKEIVCFMPIIIVLKIWLEKDLYIYNMKRIGMPEWSIYWVIFAFCVAIFYIGLGLAIRFNKEKNIKQE